ncbi:MAG: lipopolysaccharide biosynthesis protein, partial [Sphingobacterium sp.]|nr:lipopolysaccharide biosynthesis protein [Sphingobacterium sp.]
KDDKFVTETLGFTVLGTVPQMSPKELAATIQKKSSAPFIKKPQGDKAAESRRSRTRV